MADNWKQGIVYAIIVNKEILQRHYATVYTLLKTNVHIIAIKSPIDREDNDLHGTRTNKTRS